ncbi:MAG: nucleotidyltransferase family protein [Endomicrobiia bacterium]|nr:nucleotidyltransferase family protein [Endomicrobiia bacterium]
MLSTIILAAGESSRMKGFPKALLEINGRKFIEIIIEKSKDAGATDIVVVVGAHADEIKKSVDMTGVKIEVNANWSVGQLSSLRAGIAALDGKSEGFLLAPCDSPEASAETYKMLSNAWGKDKSKIYIPVSREGRGGHPTIFPRAFYRALMEEYLSRGAKSVVEKYPLEVVRMETPDDGILSDVDTLEDYAKINARKE